VLEHDALVKRVQAGDNIAVRRDGDADGKVAEAKIYLRGDRVDPAAFDALRTSKRIEPEVTQYRENGIEEVWTWSGLVAQ
jgi:hypothetical protein